MPGDKKLISNLFYPFNWQNFPDSPSWSCSRKATNQRNIYLHPNMLFHLEIGQKKNELEFPFHVVLKVFKLGVGNSTGRKKKKLMSILQFLRYMRKYGRNVWTLNHCTPAICCHMMLKAWLCLLPLLEPRISNRFHQNNTFCTQQASWWCDFFRRLQYKNSSFPHKALNSAPQNIFGINWNTDCTQTSSSPNPRKSPQPHWRFYWKAFPEERSILKQ